MTMTINELRQVLDWAEEGKLQYLINNEWKDYNLAEAGCFITTYEYFSSYRRKPNDEKTDTFHPGDLIRFTPANPIEGEYLILAKVEDRITYCNTANLPSLLSTKLTPTLEYSPDKGKTWKPCIAK